MVPSRELYSPDGDKKTKDNREKRTHPSRRTRGGTREGTRDNKRSGKEDIESPRSQGMITPIILGAKPTPTGVSMVPVMVHPSPTKPKEPSQSSLRVLDSLSEPNRISTSAGSVPASMPKTRRTFETVKLLNDNLEFNTDALKSLSESHTEYTVIGAIGMQGVGKSTILSQFCTSSMDVAAPFPEQTEDTILNASHQTTGIDLCITSDRYILLDCQAILSPSILYQMMKNEISLGTEIVSHENLMEFQSLQLVIFLQSICHVILVVQEGLVDLELWRFLLNAEMFKLGIPDLSISPEGPITIDQEYFSNLVLVMNKVPMDKITKSQIAATRQTVDRFFTDAFKTKGFNLNST
eukprot:TRINITY_DN1863_c0_g2_i1.p1 TRINITY_DN1863_c0_g2~~TRINITY_DN1863_c0_g2_i1.p1  ORF type:complete len:352 (-),score=102.82 TRINITY_DN1863_c0_g2_i1:175-1230(-)